MQEDRTNPLPPGRIAGLDYGTKRIGVAVTDSGQRIASPLDNYQRQNEEADARYFRQLVQQEQIELFVVGLPVHCSGEESQMSAVARQFGHWLQDQTGVTVAFFDERFTTHEANQLLAAGQLTRKARAARRDKLAAQIMLSAFLETQHSAPRPPSDLADDMRPDRPLH